MKTPCSFGTMLYSGQHDMEDPGFGELGFQELMGKQLSNNSITDALSIKADGRKFFNPLMITSNAFSLDNESTSRLSSSVVDSNSRDSSFIDLKLGRFGDPRDAQNSGISKGTPIPSSSESCTPPKRVRVGANSHAAYCQVYGCNKDLSSSKEYHKRHKVCDVHSKTAKVVVNGMEQRFCQQCSRFHLLAEFDDGKRSCRKRLAGHNKRRRKPQAGIHSERTGRIIQSYGGFAGGRLHGSTLATSSFICQDILPSGLLHPEKYGTNDWSRRIKVEDQTDYNLLPAIPFTSGHLHSRSPFPCNNFEKVFPTFHDNGANTATGSIFSEHYTRYPHDLGGPNCSLHSLLQDTPFGTEEFTAFDAAPTIQGLSRITESGCALSLLSSQSHNSSSHSSGIPMACPLVVPGSNTHYSTNQVSEKLVGVSSQASTSGVSNRLCSSGMSSAQGSHLGPILISDDNDTVNFEITNGIYQGSHFVNPKDHLSCEDSTTIDLFQLSSQLQRVEHQKHSMLAKQENDALCCPHII